MSRYTAAESLFGKKKEPSDPSLWREHEHYWTRGDTLHCPSLPTDWCSRLILVLHQLKCLSKWKVLCCRTHSWL